jgi:hypothetical protein
MNGLESVSLFSTQVTLLGFGFFLPAGVQTRHGFRFALAIILAVMNVLVVLYFAYHVLHVARALIVSVSMESMLGCLHKVRRCPSSWTLRTSFCSITSSQSCLAAPPKLKYGFMYGSVQTRPSDPQLFLQRLSPTGVLAGEGLRGNTLVIAAGGAAAMWAPPC